jgi:hypothetical protein
MRAARACWAAEVVCCEYIRLCSGDALHCLLVAGRRFVSIVGAVS